MIAMRLLNPQGIAGLAVALILAALLGATKIDTRHHRKQAERFEALFRAETAAHARTIADVRAATASARAADVANLARVVSARTAISERTVHDLQSRLADARSRAAALDAARLRGPNATAAAPPGDIGRATVPGISDSARGAGQAAGQDRLPPSDALLATEQAIQLDELIRWVRAQGAIPADGPPPRP